MFEMLVGLRVTDEGTYGRYRAAMLPRLESVGGGFRYDFKVSDVLIGPEDTRLNRVFVIYFPDRATADAFFIDPEYLVARESYFDRSVQDVTIIAEYTTQ